jgi:hypothetical protein
MLLIANYQAWMSANSLFCLFLPLEYHSVLAWLALRADVNWRAVLKGKHTSAFCRAQDGLAAPSPSKPVPVPITAQGERFCMRKIGVFAAYQGTQRRAWGAACDGEYRRCSREAVGATLRQALPLRAEWSHHKNKR